VDAAPAQGRRGVTYNLQVLAIVLALAVAAGPTVDRANRRAEVVVAVPGGKVVVSLDPLSSLVAHTLTLYGMNRQSGASYYTVRSDVDPVLREKLAGSLRPYMPAMEAIAARGAYRSLPDTPALRELAPGPFGEALALTWERFYQAYWARRFEAMLPEFEAMSENVDWAGALAKMQELTGREWKGDMYVFATEGTGKSALTAGANICVGPLDRDGDAGFVHEGLHLLLREEWAQAPRIQAFMAGRTFSDPFWKRWPAKYEQALVASLDILIRGLHVKYGPRGEDKVVRNYLEGVRAGDLIGIVWPLVKKHAAEPGSLEDLMLAILTQAER
jgi:hypothetical protein